MKGKVAVGLKKKKKKCSALSRNKYKWKMLSGAQIFATHTWGRLVHLTVGSCAS